MIKRLFIFAQWMAVLFLFVSLGFFFFRNDPKPVVNWDTGLTWTGFYALSIEGVADSDNPRYVSPEKLDAFLGALNDHGYTTITAGEVANFYHHDKALPENAVLLMFEGGRKNHVVWATPRLIKNRMIGLLCVPTEVTGRWGNHYIDKADLRRISRHPNWRLASMGHAAVSGVATASFDQKGAFLSQRAWLGQGYESDATFEDRVTRDYRIAAQILAKAGSTPVHAYLYPFGDPGEGGRVDPLASTINLGAVRQFHQLAFTQEGRPFNSYVSDPYALSRMRVRGDWSAEELIQRLEEWSPSAHSTPSWRSKDGTMVAGAMTLERNGGALLAGSDFWSDFDLNLSLDVATNTIGAVYLRYGGPHAFVRVSVQDQTVRVQEKRLGKLQTLASYTRTNQPSSLHSLSIRLKNNRIWVMHDNEEFARSIPVSRQLYYGHVWVNAEGGEIKMTPGHYVPLQPLYLLDGRYQQLSDELLAKSTALMPGWIDADRLHPLPERNQIEVMRAARDGIKTIPIITTRKTYARADAVALSRQVAAIFNLPSVKMLVNQFAITGYDPELAAAFNELGYQTVYIVSAEDAEALWKNNVVITRDELLLIAGEHDTVATLALQFRDRLPARRLALTVRDIEGFPAGATRVIYADHR